MQLESIAKKITTLYEYAYCKVYCPNTHAHTQVLPQRSRHDNLPTRIVYTKLRTFLFNRIISMRKMQKFAHSN